MDGAPHRPGLIFVFGGARSGKSRFAEGLVEAEPGPWAYLATAEAFDEEMTERIARHRTRRPSGWETFDAPLALAGALSLVPAHQPVLVDCLTLWLSNHLLAGHDLDREADGLLDALGGRPGLTVCVASEVGLGIVPDNALARRFRDAAGCLNQRVAAMAGRVVFLAAGLPLEMKPPLAAQGA